MIRKFFRVLLVLWAGSLWSLTWVTWTLFHAQSDRHLAGVLAGPLFSIEAYVGVSVAALALYDMCKAVDKTMRIEDIRVVEKIKE